MSLKVEIDREEDGRWIAEVVNLPGVMVYGDSERDAIKRVEVLALRVVADRIEQGELSAESANLHFEFARAAA
jgi:predicted RNase H-like HicB family nuclease